jgi:hypothetical protein
VGGVVAVLVRVAVAELVEVLVGLEVGTTVPDDWLTIVKLYVRLAVSVPNPPDCENALTTTVLLPRVP